MKKILFALALTTSLAHAHMIVGTRVLKGSLKTKVSVSGVDTECRASVDKVKNLLEEDKFGNPAYKVQVEVSLDGKDAKKKITVKQELKVTMNNLFADGVKDFEYASPEGVGMKIDQEGRIVSITVPYQGQRVVCSF